MSGTLSFLIAFTMYGSISSGAGSFSIHDQSIFESDKFDIYSGYQTVRGRYRKVKDEHDTLLKIKDVVNITGAEDLPRAEDKDHEVTEKNSTLNMYALDYKINIPDPNLQSAVRNYLGLTQGEAIYKSYVDWITEFDASGLNISSLEGLQYFSNLEALCLDNNNTSDLSPIKNLTKLTTLYLYNNNISDISSLSNLVNLIDLDLFGNNITDISVLSRLKKLTCLLLGYNNISDISSLSGLTDLIILYIGNNQISSISSISNLTKLRALWINDNNISDISILNRFPSLEILYAYNNDISNIDSLSNLINLVELDLEGNQIKNISNLIRLTKLNTLYLYDNPIMNIDVVSNFKNLRSFSAGGYYLITDISALKNLTNLEFLYISHNLIYSIADLINLTRLKELDVGSNLITDISVVGRMTSLEYLNISRNFIKDISMLNMLYSLVELNIEENEIEDISSLKSLTNLEYFYAYYNNISSISALSGLSKLKELNLSTNAISNISSLTNKPNLIYLNLANNRISNISSLSGLTNLRALWIGGNDISDITPLAGLTNMELLSVQNNNITNIYPLRNMSKLIVLDISSNKISDISYISHFHDLGCLAAYENNISNISALSNLTKMQILYLNINQISDISPLVNLVNLKILYLGKNKITDFSPVSGYYNNLVDKDFTITKISLTSISFSKTVMDVILTVSPKPFTRAEIARFLVKSFGLENESSDSNFSDVPVGSEYYHDISVAVEKGWMNGYPDGSYKPDSVLTRAEFATVVVRALGYDISTQYSDVSDVPFNHWAYNYVCTAINAGLMALDSDGAFRPEENMMMDQTCYLLPIVYPLNATDKKITWISNNPDVVKVEQNGLLKAVGFGEADVTAVTRDGNLKASCKITVQRSVDDQSINNEFVVTDVFCTDLNNQNISRLQDNMIVRSSAMVTNLSDITKNIKMIVAIYDENNAIKYVQIAEKAIGKEKTEKIEKIFQLPEQMSGCTMKVMLWDSFDGSNPITEALKVP